APERVRRPRGIEKDQDEDPATYCAQFCKGLDVCVVGDTPLAGVTHRLPVGALRDGEVARSDTDDEVLAPVLPTTLPDSLASGFVGVVVVILQVREREHARAERLRRGAPRH